MKRLLSAVLTLLVTAAALSACSPSSGGGEEAGTGIPPGTADNNVTRTTYSEMARDGDLALLFNRDTTAFQIRNTADGWVYGSMPENPGNGRERALFELSYMDANGTVATMNSYDDSVAKGQYTLEDVPGGVKIVFTLGTVVENLYCPSAFSKDRFEDILEKIDGYIDRSLFRSYYYLVSEDKLGENRGDILSKYPRVKEEPLYILKQETMSISAQRDVDKILRSTGYGDEDYAADKVNSSMEQVNAYPHFTVPLQISLENERLVAQVLMEEVKEYNQAVIVSVSLLKYFASPERDEAGRFLLPDGSGSLMTYYSEKGKQQEYKAPVYGRDKSVQLEEKIFKEEQAYIPVFGKLYDKRAVLGVVESGDALSEIVSHPGTADAYAYAYALFRVRETAKTYLSSSSREEGDFFMISQKKITSENLTASFAFFGAENSTVKHLADYYAARVFGGGEKKAAPAPLVLDFIGSVKEDASVFGIHLNRSVAYTTLSQVREIGGELVRAGAQNLVFRLTGFFNEGVDHAFPGKLKLNKAVGDEKDLEALLSWAEKNGVELYFDADIQYAYTDGLSDGFSSNRDCSYLLTKNKGVDYGYLPATYELDKTKPGRFILNPGAVDRALRSVADAFSKRSIPGASLRWAGTDLNADFKENRSVERQDAMLRLRDGIAGLAEKNSLLTAGVNRPLLPYLKQAVNVPATSSRYSITDESVPFLQMVIAGRFGYTDDSLNLNGNTPEQVLSALRTGSGFSYTITANEEKDFQKTEHTEYYSTKFTVWRDDILKKSAMLREVHPVVSTGILDTSELRAGVVKTVYAGGWLITNQSDAEYVYESRAVPPGGYLLGKAGE